jgi:hypothetical protein
MIIGHTNCELGFCLDDRGFTHPQKVQYHNLGTRTRGSTLIRPAAILFRGTAPIFHGGVPTNNESVSGHDDKNSSFDPGKYLLLPYTCELRTTAP